MQRATSRRTHAEMLRISENIKITQDLTAGTSGMPSPTVLNSDIFDTQKRGCCKMRFCENFPF